jgi:Uma2 family endonuclease
MTIEMLEPDLEQSETQEVGEDGKKMASGRHSGISMLLGIYLGTHVINHNLGYVLDSSALYDFKDEQPKRQPDVSFISLEKLPELPDETLTVAPDLAVEVVSKNDTAYQIETKVMQYQQAGVRLIWIIYPISQSVDVYHLESGLMLKRFMGEAELDGEDVIPGFKLPVKKLFK